MPGGDQPLAALEARGRVAGEDCHDGPVDASPPRLGRMSGAPRRRIRHARRREDRLCRLPWREAEDGQAAEDVGRAEAAHRVRGGARAHGRLDDLPRRERGGDPHRARIRLGPGRRRRRSAPRSCPRRGRCEARSCPSRLFRSRREGRYQRSRRRRSAAPGGASSALHRHLPRRRLRRGRRRVR